MTRLHVITARTQKPSRRDSSSSYKACRTVQSHRSHIWDRWPVHWADSILLLPLYFCLSRFFCCLCNADVVMKHKLCSHLVFADRADRSRASMLPLRGSGPSHRGWGCEGGGWAKRVGGGLTSSFVHTERSLKETQTEEMRGQTEYVCRKGALWWCCGCVITDRWCRWCSMNPPLKFYPLISGLCHILLLENQRNIQILPQGIQVCIQDCLMFRPNICTRKKLTRKHLETDPPPRKAGKAFICWSVTRLAYHAKEETALTSLTGPSAGCNLNPELC